MATKKKRPQSLGPLHSQRTAIPKVPSVPSLVFSNASGDAKSFVSCRKESEEVEELREKLAEAEARYNKLFFINEQANIDLAHERHRVGQMERKLRFIKENQHVFEKLKEAYMSMRYNQATTGRKLVEISEKGVQTWQGIVCQACLGTEKLRAELEACRASYEDCVLVKKDEMWKLTETVAKLRNYATNLASEGIKEELRNAETIPEMREIEKRTAALLGICNKAALIARNVAEEKDAKKEHKDGNAVMAKVKEFEQKLCTKSTATTLTRRTNQGSEVNKDIKTGGNRKENEDRNKTENKGSVEEVMLNPDENVKTESGAAEKDESEQREVNGKNSMGNAEVKNEEIMIENLVELNSPSAEEVDAEYSRHLERLIKYGVMLRNLATTRGSKSVMQIKSPLHRRT